ncbi:hypothetical protein [Microbacterium sp. CSI-V]|uniref:hypothetical protein n=1 Tax=Microbacterium sp. CSI-V TaxID=1933777 RepID=UPI0011155530|nr:hypothetical protein [Microbacterium sp. CSI-V]
MIASDIKRAIARLIRPAAVPVEREETRPAHLARLRRATVYFVYTQGTAKPLNLGKATQMLLEAEVATTGAWPSEDKVRLAPSLARIDASVARARATAAFVETITTWRSLLAAVMFHPILLARALVFLIRGMRNEDPEASAQPEADENGADPWDEVEALLLESQKVTVSERFLDADLFGGDAQAEDHFVRLFLRPTSHEIVIDGTSTEITVEPRLLLHRDGVIQLVAGFELPRHATVSQVVYGANMDEPLIRRSEVPETFRPAGATWAGGDWLEAPVAGVRYRRLQHDEEPSTVAEYMSFLADNVAGHISATLGGGWNGYPVVIAEADSCCADWAQQHPAELANLVAREGVAPGGRRLRDVTLRDFASFDDHSMFHTLASATIMNWRPWQPGIKDLSFTMLYEHALLLYWRATRVEREVRTVPSKRRRVTELSQTALFMEAEARGVFVRAGGARDIFRDVAGTLGVPEILQTVSKGLSLSSDRAAARASDRVARGARNVAVFGLAVATFAAVPAVPQLFELVEAQREADPGSSWWVTLQTVISSPLQISGILLAVISLFGVVWVGRVVVAVVSYLWGIRKRGYASHLSGYEVDLEQPKNVTEDSTRGRTT